MGGELVWLPKDRVLHVWGCGTGCQGVRVYALDGTLSFDETSSLHEVAKDGSVASVQNGGVVRLFDAASGATFSFAGDPRLEMPLEIRFPKHGLVAIRFTEQDSPDVELELECALTQRTGRTTAALACTTSPAPQRPVPDR